MSNLYEFFEKLNKKYGNLVKWNLFNRTQVNKNIETFFAKKKYYYFICHLGFYI